MQRTHACSITRCKVTFESCGTFRVTVHALFLLLNRKVPREATNVCTTYHLHLLLSLLQSDAWELPTLLPAKRQRVYT